MIAYIVAIAVLNIGLGFALAVYLTRQHHGGTAGEGHGETVDWASEALSHRASASQGTAGYIPSGGPFAAEDRGVVPQTVEGLKARVQQCNERLAGA